MRHLYSSKVRVIHLVSDIQAGAATTEWQTRTEILDPYCEPGYMWCRIDLQFVRLGRDQLVFTNEGVMPDRFGTLYNDPTDFLDKGNKIVCVEGPVSGTFEINAKPDLIQNYRIIHHSEVQIVESSQLNLNHYPATGA